MKFHSTNENLKALIIDLVGLQQFIGLILNYNTGFDRLIKWSVIGWFDSVCLFSKLCITSAVGLYILYEFV